MAIRPYRLILLSLAAASVLAAVLTVAFCRGAADPVRCLEGSLKGAKLTEFAESLESEGEISRLAGFSCRGLSGLTESSREREALSLKLTRTFIADSDFRYGLYQAHIERALGGAVNRGALRPILESLDELLRDEKAARSCPATSAGKVADYDGLQAPLISAMLLRSSLTRANGEAGRAARDLAPLLELAAQLPNFPRSSCTEAARYFVAMNAFMAGLHPLAKDCKPRLDGTDVILDCTSAP
jgi:hypothetical protein